jgi:hypothetical protein
MSRKTRIKRPTTATPRNVGTRRYLHVSARLTDEIDRKGKPTGRLVVLHGETYRKREVRS